MEAMIGVECFFEVGSVIRPQSAAYSAGFGTTRNMKYWCVDNGRLMYQNAKLYDEPLLSTFARKYRKFHLAVNFHSRPPAFAYGLILSANRNNTVSLSTRFNQKRDEVYELFTVSSQ